MARAGTCGCQTDHSARPSLGQRVYMGLVWGEAIPDEYIIWEMAEQFGWSLEYIQTLPEARWREWLEVKRGKGLVQNSIIGKGSPVKHGKKNR